MSHDQKMEDSVKFDTACKDRGESDGSLWHLIRSIHSIPPLRDWVTIESMPLCPFVQRISEDDTQAAAFVHVLLVGPGRDGRFPIPWGYVVWQWPSRKVLGMLDIRGLPASPVILGVEHLATREYVESVERALATGAIIPLPPRPLSELYGAVFQRTPYPGSNQRGPTGPIAVKSETAPSPDGGHSTAIPSSAFCSGTTAEFMNRGKALIEESKQPACLGAWRQLYTRIGQTGFSVAIAGEFSRGKSTLINTLLGNDILPAADLPTTAMVTRVLYGPEPTLWHIQPGRHRQRLELSPDSWQRLVAKDEGTDPEGVVQVEIPNPWLQQTGIQLIDTPGAGDLTEARAALAIETISHCDAVIVAVSATMPLSLTERSFLDEHVLSRKIPRVAVVLTRMDQVSEADRATVFSFVKNKLHELAPAVELWCIHDNELVKMDSSGGVLGPQAILRKLDAWASDPDHRRLRTVQVLSQLDGLLSTLEGALKVQLATAEATVEEQTKAAQAAAGELDRQKLDWEDLRLEMDARQRATEQWLEKAVQDAKTPWVESLCYEAQRAPNPKEWWEKDLPYRLRRELLVLTRSLNAGLRNRIAEDAGWLYSQVKHKFSWTLSLSRPTESVGLDDVPASDDLTAVGGLEDMSKMQLFARLGIGAVTIASFIHPAARLAGLGFGLIGGAVAEKLFRGKVDEQRTSAASAVPKVIDDVLAKSVGKVLIRIRGYYRTVLTEVLREQSLWFEARKQAIANGRESMNSAHGSRRTVELRASIGKIDELRKEIFSAKRGSQ